MTRLGHDEAGEGADPGLLELYRASAREAPSARVDAVIMDAAQAEVRSRRYAPWAALAATLLIVAMLAPALRRQMSASYDHDAADAYLMQVQVPITPDQTADPHEAYLLELPSASGM